MGFETLFALNISQLRRQYAFIMYIIDNFSK